MKKYILAILIAVLALAVPVCAKTSDEIQKELDEYEAELEEAKDKSKDTADQIDDVSARITELTEKTNEENEKIEELQKSMACRIKYFYESEGSTASFFDVLIGDGTFSGILNRASYMQQMHEYDNKQLQAYTDLLESLNEESEQLDSSYEELNSLLDEQDKEIEELNQKVEDKKKELEEAKDEEEKARLQQEAEEAEEAAASVSNASATGAVKESGKTSGGKLTRSKGVVWYNGHRETWYSQKVLPGGGLHIPGRHVNDEGLICDQDGYICVASTKYKKGTIVETSLGTAKVYDSGCRYDTIDIYTDW